MSTYLGDFAAAAIVDFKWSTNSAAGASITRATNGTVAVYIGNGLTQLTAGVTDTEDFDGVTGVHHCRIDLSADAGYAAGSECQVVLAGATIDGQTVNSVLAHFSIERAGGVLALLKGANGLSAIKTETASIQADTNDIQTRLPAALVAGRMDASVGAMGADVITAAALAASAGTELAAAVWDEALAGHATAGSTGAALNDIPTNAELATALAAADDAVLAQVALVKAKTDNLPIDPADQSLIIAATDSLATAIAAVPTATQNADALLKRDWTAVAGEASRSVLNALRHIRNKWSLSGATLTVTKEDDLTAAWTAAVTTDPTAEPITGSDPV